MSHKRQTGGTGHSDISGTNGVRAQFRAARGSRKAKPKRVGFTRERKERFLNHFAATANAVGAARAAGVAKSTVYEHRRKDLRFHEAWCEALAQGVARAEAEGVRWAEQAFKIRPNARADKAAREMDPKVALAIIQSYKRNGDRRPGEILIQPYDMEEIRARIEKKMRALGWLEESSGGGAAEPSTTSYAGGPPPQRQNDREER